MANKDLLKPGQKTPDSGQYEIVGPRGGKTNFGEVTGVEGKKLPPTPEAGLKYKEVDLTKHRK